VTAIIDQLQEEEMSKVIYVVVWDAAQGRKA
jgi:hypothetical protein